MSGCGLHPTLIQQFGGRVLVLIVRLMVSMTGTTVSGCQSSALLPRGVRSGVREGGTAGGDRITSTTAASLMPRTSAAGSVSPPAPTVVEVLHALADDLTPAYHAHLTAVWQGIIAELEEADDEENVPASPTWSTASKPHGGRVPGVAAK
jgi:hypothetical protein